MTAQLKLKTAAGGSVTLAPPSTATDLTLTLPSVNTALVGENSFSGSDGASKIGYLPAGAGAVATDVQTQLNRFAKSPKQFGGVGDGTANDTLALRNAITAAKAENVFIDLTGASVGWKVNAEIDFTGISGVICAYDSPILADVTGTYANGFVAQFGNPAVGWNDGRHSGCVIAGTLHVVALSRAVAMHGIYMKGSWFNAGHIMASGFNGMGIRQDSVWDSTFQRLYTELCGNVTDFSLVLNSTGDTHNATAISSVQCEQAYHRGMNINVIRATIGNIHAERLAILSASDGTPTYGYLNHSITLSNSHVDQCIFDCLTSGTAPDGQALAATVLNMRVVGDKSKTTAFNSITTRIIHDYGRHFEFDVLTADYFIQRAPAVYTEVSNADVTNVDIEQVIDFNLCSIGTLTFGFNASDIHIEGGAVSTLSFPNNIQGNISFNQVVLQTVGETKEPAAAKLPVTFNDCNINVFNGAYNAQAVVSGGRVNTCALASQSLARFEDVDFGVFGYSGNSGFITRNCRGPAASTWTVPMNVNYPAGTITERVGYNAAGKFYQNTDSGLTWVAV